MNILYLLNSGQPGGMERHVEDLVKGMGERGHKVHIWCKNGPIVEWHRKSGAVVSVKDISLDIDPFYIFSLRSYLIQNKIDIIHAHELRACSNALIAGFLSGTKVRVTHIHTPISEWRVSNTFRKIYTRFTILGYVCEITLLSTCEIALTESRKRIKIREGIPEDKLKVIPNGIDIEKFDVDPERKKTYREEILKKYDIPNDSFVVGNVGRLTEEKGTDILVKGFEKFIHNIPESERNNKYLLIAGGGKLENTFKKIVKSSAVGDKIRITGVFEDDDIRKLYASFDLFVFPTLAEGFGIVMLEAMSIGLPVICSDLEVLSEVGGASVYMFKTGDYRSLAQKMHDLYLRKDNYSDIGEISKRRVAELYSMKRFLDNYENLYFGLLQGSKKI